MMPKAMRSMINYQPGDVILVKFPYVQAGQSKVPPGLVLIDSGDNDVLVARVTSRPALPPFEVFLAGWQQAGLRAPCVVRLHKQATISKSAVLRSRGHLEQNDRRHVSTLLSKMFGSW